MCTYLYQPCIDGGGSTQDCSQCYANCYSGCKN